MRPMGPVLSACLIFALAPTLGAAPGDDMYARTGPIVAAHGARLNLYCSGSGRPTIVFDAGHQDWAPAWAVVQPLVARWTSACSYDRPGYGFSDPGPMPRGSCSRHEAGADHALRAGGISPRSMSSAVQSLLEPHSTRMEPHTSQCTDGAWPTKLVLTSTKTLLHLAQAR